jgi:hypothetical protein
LKTIVTAINTTTLLDRTRQSFCKTLIRTTLTKYDETTHTAFAEFVAWFDGFEELRARYSPQASADERQVSD